MPIPPPVKAVLRKDLLLGVGAGALVCALIVGAALSIGGLFAPLDTLPQALQNIAPAMPTYAVGEIARSPITHSGFTATHVALLVGWTVAFAVGTALLFRRDTTRG